MKFKKIFLVLILVLLTGCNNSNKNSSISERPSDIYTPEQKVEALWMDSYGDATTFVTMDDVKDVHYYLNGNYEVDVTKQITEDSDGKYIFYNDSNARIVNISEGYAITVPYSNVDADYSLGEFRCKYIFNDGILTTSFQNKSPYGNTPQGWNIYLTEWIDRFISDSGFINTNNLNYTRQPSISKQIMIGYEVYQYDIMINNNQGIDHPYYNIAIIRPITSYTSFYLFVYKASSNKTMEFDNILRSFDPITKIGVAKNHVGQYPVNIPEYWNAETKAYYDKLLKFEKTDWGVFTHSMYSEEQGDIEAQDTKIESEKNRLEEALDYSYGIMPTYTHISWGSTPHHFPTASANKFAGGNGFNGKPVLQFTYQFTTSNNTGIDGYTPMFDVLRGKYDEQFKRLARDIKAYKHPVLFRLNNEMNTDWTSYAGIVTLCDPDIFIYTWQRLYNIFEEEGVDNCIWIFNPIARTCPFSNWGEHLAFFPGADYVQILGLTHYEFGNGETIPSFEETHRALYEKNKDYFMNYPWVISEFACGSGGTKNYETGEFDWGLAKRNKDLQAQWVKEMFECFALRNEPGYEFVKNIVGAIWFGCNDYETYNGESFPVNYLQLDRDLKDTLENFKNGLKATQ